MWLNETSHCMGSVMVMMQRECVRVESKCLTSQRLFHAHRHLQSQPEHAVTQHHPFRQISHAGIISQWHQVKNIPFCFHCAFKACSYFSYVRTPIWLLKELSVLFTTAHWHLAIAMAPGKVISVTPLHQKISNHLTSWHQAQQIKSSDCG